MVNLKLKLGSDESATLVMQHCKLKHLSCMSTLTPIVCHNFICNKVQLFCDVYFAVML